MYYITPEQAGISSADVLNFYRELEANRLSTHAVILARGDARTRVQLTKIVNFRLIAPSSCHNMDKGHNLTAVPSSLCLLNAYLVLGFGCSIYRM